MPDHLVELSRLAKKRVTNGYYDTDAAVRRIHRSLVRAIETSRKTPVIAEIKYASPSSGKIRDFESPLKIAEEMVAGGTCGSEDRLNDRRGETTGPGSAGRSQRHTRVPRDANPQTRSVRNQ